MRALSIRQPYLELILRGIKTVEYRSQATKIVGERFYLYASGKWSGGKSDRAVGSKRAKKAKAWSLDLAQPKVADESALPWMIELANALRLFPHELPTQVILGTAKIERVTQRADGMFEWHLAEVERLARPRKPKGHPQPVWFLPF